MSHRRALHLVWIAAFSLCAPPALAEPVLTESESIVGVTVFADRAEVTRRAQASIPAGASTIEFLPLPRDIEKGSLRLRAEGVPALLGAVEVSVRVEEARDTGELVALEEEIERLTGAKSALEAEAKNDRVLRDFLGGVGASPLRAEGGAASDASALLANPAQVASMFQVLQDKLAILAERELARGETLEELNEDLRLARAKLKEMRPRQGIRKRIARVEVEAERAGTLSLELSYVVAAASWKPLYRVHLDGEEASVMLVSEGAVSQRSGEDWSKVRLVLSTASPALGLEAPWLLSQTLTPRLGGRARGDFGDREAQGRQHQNVLSLAPGAESKSSGGAPAGFAPALLSSSAFNVTFAVPGTSDVPSDGSDHRFVLRRDELPGKLVYFVVPALDTSAYLTAIVTSPEEYPLLRGDARVFTDGSYIGRFLLEEIGPGLEMRVPFGPNRGVEVTRLPVPKESATSGFGGKTTEVRYARRTGVENLRDEAVTIVFEERRPVSEDERIEVILDKKTTTPGWTPSKKRPGVMIWTFDLGPRESREISVAYRVEHPSELQVDGLE